VLVPLHLRNRARIELGPLERFRIDNRVIRRLS
jgi:hypothetical protein